MQVLQGNGLQEMCSRSVFVHSIEWFCGRNEVHRLRQVSELISVNLAAHNVSGESISIIFDFPP